MNKLGQIIKQKRKAADLSLRELAEKCGISHSYLDSLEKGVSPRNQKEISPTLETMEKLAIGLGINLEELLIKAGLINSKYIQEPKSGSIYETSALYEMNADVKKATIYKTNGEVLDISELEQEEQDYLWKLAETFKKKPKK